MQAPSDPAITACAHGGPAGRGGRAPALRALRHRDFALFFCGAFVSNIGMWMQAVTVPAVLYQGTDRAAWIGFGAFLHFLPALLVGGVGGVYADRFPRRRILLVTQSVSMLVAAALWWSVQGGQAHPGLVAGLVAVTGLASGFGIPAWQSFVPDLVPRGDLLPAVALNSAQFNASRAVGFIIGGLTLAALGPAVAFAANALSYLAVLAALLMIRAGRVASRRRQPGRGSFRVGFAHATERPGVLLAVTTVGVVAFLGGPVIQLAPVFARHEFAAGDSAYGLLAAMLGLGATLASLAVAGYADGLRRSRLTVGAVAGYGAAVVALGLSHSYATGLAAMFAIGIGYLVVVTVLNTAIQLAVEDTYRGRVLALFGMAFTAGFPLGSLLQGELADRVGIRPVVVVAGALMISYAVWLRFRARGLGALDTEPGGGVESNPGVPASTANVSPAAVSAAFE